MYDGIEGDIAEQKRAAGIPENVPMFSQRSRSVLGKAPKIQLPSRSHRSMPSRSLSVTDSYRSSTASSAIDALMNAHDALSARSRGGIPATGRSTVRMATHRSIPKTQAQLRSADKLSKNRLTFGPGSNNRSPVPRLPALDLPGGKSPSPSKFADIPNPVQAKHGLDGRATMPFKTVGNGGLTKEKTKGWTGGADRTLNKDIAQPV